MEATMNQFKSTSDNYWKSASNTLWNFLANQSPMLWIFLILVNVLTYRMKVNKARPKDGSALAAIKVLTLYSPLDVLCCFFRSGLHLLRHPYGISSTKNNVLFCRVRPATLAKLWLYNFYQ